MEKSVVNRVKEIRLAKGLSQDEVGARIGKTRGQISRIEAGSGQLTENWLNLLSFALECPPAEIISSDCGRFVPVIGEVPGGNLMEAIQQEPETYIQFSSRKSNLRAFKVKGNSMSRIAPHGVYIVVDFDDNDPATLSNQPVLFCIDQDGVHECGFKIYKRNPDRFEPFSIEPGYETVFPNNQPWKIYARVVGCVGFFGEDAKLITYHG